MEDGRVTGLRLEADGGDGPVELKGTVVLASGGCEPTDRPMDSMGFFLQKTWGRWLGQQGDGVVVFRLNTMVTRTWGGKDDGF